MGKRGRGQGCVGFLGVVGWGRGGGAVVFVVLVGFITLFIFNMRSTLCHISVY